MKFFLLVTVKIFLLINVKMSPIDGILINIYEQEK